MIPILIFFVAASLLLYVVLGGADYGAGILELFPAGKWRDKQKALINQAMGPVWEANHMWLIIIVVILFMGFPKAFEILMTSLHLPMVALLVGIVVRGAAFTFRHYDADPGPFSQGLYTWIFGLSSLWTSIWLGIIAASLFRGRLTTETSDFYTAYVAPWYGFFPLVMGLFVASLFTYLACIYLIGESEEEGLQRRFRRYGFAFNLALIILGAAVFACSLYDGNLLLSEFLNNPFSLACLFGATLVFGIMWRLSVRRRIYWVRILAAGQVALILFGWYFIHYPDLFVMDSGALSFEQAAAPEATLRQLTLALMVGSVFIFPSLFFLLKVFKTRSSH